MFNDEETNVYIQTSNDYTSNYHTSNDYDE